MEPVVSVLAAVTVVAAAALVGRRLARAGDERPLRPPPGDDDVGAELPDLDAGAELPDLDAGPDEAVAVTSDGWAFVPRGDAVRLVPAGAEQAVEEAAVRSGGGPGEALSPGDFIAARVRRGAPDRDPWRLEALGRDHEFLAFAFETREAAAAALDLVARRVVRPPVDETGAPIPVGDEDFAVARRKRDETESDLAMGDGDDDLVR